MMNEFTYFEDGQIDRVMGVIWQLGQEVYTTRQRVLALEELLAAKGIVERGELDAFRPSEAAQARLTADGKYLMERLIRTISEVNDSRVPMRDQFIDELAQAAG